VNVFSAANFAQSQAVFAGWISDPGVWIVVFSLFLPVLSATANFTDYGTPVAKRYST
jgi:uncharacterized membrane protein YdjX (TVP38/TMEM64 family)